MSEIKQAKTEPTELFWGTAEDTGFGMLGVEGSGQHMQPMTHFVDKEAKALWFITDKTTDLAKAINTSKTAHFTVVSKGQDVQICAKGQLAAVHDPRKLEDLWNPVVGAWFDGVEDPSIALLRLTLQDAAIWASTDSSFAFAWEIAKAQAKDKDPDVGTHRIVTF